MLNKKRLVAATLTGLTSLVLVSQASAFEALNGFYLGAQGGWGDIHQDGFTGPGSSSSDTGVAGRLFGGYKVNDNFGLEAGYTKFSNMNTKINFGGGDSVSGTIQAYAVDLVVKGILPLQNGFDLYGKVGGAYLNETSSASLNVPGGSFTSDDDTQGRILPTFGAGLSYTFNPNLSGDVSWMHIQKVGDTELNNTDFFGVGLTYNFG